jgi:pimeloyl-ACP methyl ester carboxylesterase
MALRESSEPLGPPWRRPLRGALDELVVESELLAGNPLGDPAVRPLYVYRSPGVAAGRAEGVPAVYVLQGYFGQLDRWLNRESFEPAFLERLDAMFADGECGDAVVVLVDCWTSLGGSQFLNSPATGRYMDYLCDEVVPFVDGRYPVAPERGARGLAGHSSGGYGALVTAMLRPDVFTALASHAGDALFECCYLRDFPEAARTLRDHFAGSFERLLAELPLADPFDFRRFGTALSIYGCAAAYSPDPDRPGQVLLPFDTATGRLIPDVWERWLTHDPVRMAPGHAEALLGCKRIYLDAGRRDEYFLDLGAQALARELDRLGVGYTLELFDGGHGGVEYRYPVAIRELVAAMSA